jgi:hypothetical protein
MGSRSGTLYDRTLAYETELVKIYGSIVVGAAGAVTSFQGGGFESVTKETAAGNYTIGLKHAYDRLLFVNVVPVKATVSDVASVQVLNAPATLQATFKGGEVVIQLLDEAGAAVNAASGEVLLVEITARRGSVGPYDA